MQGRPRRVDCGEVPWKRIGLGVRGRRAGGRVGGREGAGDGTSMGDAELGATGAGCGMRLPYFMIWAYAAAMVFGIVSVACSGTWLGVLPYLGGSAHALHFLFSAACLQLSYNT